MAGEPMFLNLRKGYIFLHSGSGLLAWLIKKVTKSRWSHAGWITGTRQVIEANFDGVEMGVAYGAKNIAIIRLKVPDEQIEQCIQYVEGKVGRKYDYKLFFGLFWRWLWGWDRKKDVPDWGKGYICSELVAKPVAMFCGIHFNPEVDTQNIVPEDIWRWAVLNPDKAEIVYLGSGVKN